MTRIGVIFALLVASAVNPALAYHGGPDVFEPLGWSAKEQRVYWLVHGRNESGEGPAVYFAELGVGKSRTAVRVDWSQGDLDSAGMRRLELLRRRLAPLRETFGEATVSGPTVSVEEIGPGSRRIVRGRFRAGYAFEVVAYCQADVMLLHDYAIPGRRERLAVVAFIGIADYCEETQEAVIAVPGQALPPLEYVNRWR